MKVLKISSLLILLAIYACKDYESEEIYLSVISDVMDCEEENIHLRITYSERKDIIGDIILPVCNKDSICMDYFYSMKSSDSSKMYEIKGYLSKKNHNKFDYGCVDSKYFKITNINFIGEVID